MGSGSFLFLVSVFKIIFAEEKEEMTMEVVPMFVLAEAKEENDDGGGPHDHFGRRKRRK